MNERIRELWEQSKTSGVHPEFGEYDKYSVVKFAELIVRECAKVADDGFASSNFGNGITGHQLLKHFGVEE